MGTCDILFGKTKVFMRIPASNKAEKGLQDIVMIIILPLY